MNHTPLSTLRRAGLGGLVTGALLLCSHASYAHHPMGGRTPSTFVEGLLSGFGHPIIGIDHFAFIVAIGLLAIGPARRLLAPVLFVAMTMVGTGLHLLRVDLAAAEALIALTVLAAGVLLVLNRRQTLGLLLPLATIGGLLHGYAYGESIVGAEATPLLSYLAGFGIVQLGIALAARWFGEGVLKAANAGLLGRFSRVAGSAVCGVGAVYLGLALQAA